MAQEGITSAQGLQADEYYTRQYRPALQRWISALRQEEEPETLFHPWPDLNTSMIFRKLAGDACDSIGTALKALGLQSDIEGLRRFRDAYESGDHQRRTDWENLANDMREHSFSDNLYRELMHAANEAYQYSWGCALSEGDNIVNVETRAPKHLDLDVCLPSADRSDRGAVSLLVPNFKLAHRKIGDNWSKLAEIVLPGTPIHRAKMDFRRSLETYYRSHATEATKTLVDRAANAYSAALSDHFKSDKRASLVFGYAAALGGAGLGLAVAPVGLLAAAGIGLAIAVTTVTADGLGAAHAMMKIVPKRGRWIATTTDAAGIAIASTFTVDETAAAKYRSGVPTFKSK
jgi:hypothetical protein